MLLVVLAGLPATGKTTLAKKIAGRIGAADILRTDAIRKEIIKEPKYTEEEKDAVYREMFSRAEKELSGKNVILDANFYRQNQRAEAKNIAARAGAKFLLVEVTCPEDEIRKRMAGREKSKDESDARKMEIYYKIKSAWEPISEPHIIVDTSKPNPMKALSEVLKK